MKVYNFSPGPAMLPTAVIQEAQHNLLNWQSSGLSVMELPHRDRYFKNIAEESEQDLRDLLAIPLDYTILFLTGGARSQFAMVPMNLLEKNSEAAYINTGIWSQKAIAEAKLYCHVNVVASSENENFTTIPSIEDWQRAEKSAYFHYVDNETIAGVEFPYVPPIKNMPLVCDMSSNLLSRPVDIAKYGLIYASAQKNVGIAGLTVVIIHRDLLKRKPLEKTPSMFRYHLQAEEKSFYNTPPTFPWYITSLVLKWTKAQGGLKKMAAMNDEKAKLLYEYIDHSHFYHNPINPSYRSRMNVSFTLKNETLNETFLTEAEKNGLFYLKGHRLYGGMRASIYNGMPKEGVLALIAFMRHFENQYA